MGVTKRRDVVCNGCGGRGGGHIDLKCPFYLDRLTARMPKDRRYKGDRKRALKGLTE